MTSFAWSNRVTDVTFSSASSSASMASKDSSKRIGDFDGLRDVRRLEVWLLSGVTASSLGLSAASVLGSGSELT